MARQPLPFHPNPRLSKPPSKSELEKATLLATQAGRGLSIDLLFPADVVPITRRPTR